ncbi:hypothetical protein MMC14_004767 [Varicellaria rhodocarpa]|nr:hypothetical protein [Varicellaria rhodocarpa]
MLIHISLLFLLQIKPLLSAPPSSPPASEKCPSGSGGNRRQIDCFTGGVGRPNPGDCYRAMHEVLSGNTATDKSPIRFSTMPGVHGTQSLPWSWVQPGCIVLIDVSRTTVGFDPGDSSDNAVVEVSSLWEVAVVSQEIMENCILGGPQLGGRTLIGENNILSLYVAKAPEKKKSPVSVSPITEADYPALMDLTLQLCADSF